MNNLFMTDSQRLYKIGYIARAVSGDGKKDGQYVQDQHRIYIFDHLMTGTESRKAAFYFYSEFLQPRRFDFRSPANPKISTRKR